MHSFRQSTLSQSRWTNKILKEKLIPTVSIAVRGTSSWKNWYVESAD
jgi:methylenetetrahydrofolate reductase (NADPH)